MGDPTGDLASTLRTMAAHESEQVNRRLSWLANFQGFLFAALAFAWDKSRSATIVLVLLGAVVAILVFIGLLGATFAVQRIRKHWRENHPKDYVGPDIMGFYPDAAPWSVYIAPENLLPLAFLLAWIAILVIRLRS